MAKTNKEILEGFAAEMRAAYQEKQGRLRTLDELDFSEPIKKQYREEIVRIFHDKMEEIKRRPGYEEALQSVRLKGVAKHKMHEAEKDYQEAQRTYKEAKISYMGALYTNEELYGNEEKILENLKESCVKVEKIEMMGYKGKKVQINLPEVKGRCDGFKFEFFVSDKSVRKDDFEKNPELENKSYSMEDVGGLLGAISKYMEAMGVTIDGDMDHENYLKSWVTDQFTCNAGDALRYIVGLLDNNSYWLKDKDVFGKGSRVLWKFYGEMLDGCFFGHTNDAVYRGVNDVAAKLFLRLS